MALSKDDGPLLIVLGQSNAHAHATKLAPQERILTPLKNVYGLSRTDNQSYGLEKVTWSGYTSAGMNLGETQDHTCSMATEFAKMWQSRVDKGEYLPDLYIIQISIGSQGILQEDYFRGNDLSMWWPQRPEILIPGPLGKANISLYPLTLEILSLAAQSIRDMGKNPVVLGLHWNQWETEVCCGLRNTRRSFEVYPAFFTGFSEALGMEYPLFLYRPLADCYEDTQAKNEMAAYIEGLSQKSSKVVLLDPRKTELWDPDTFEHGIFRQDGVHYLPWVHRWFAKQQWLAGKKMGYWD